MLIIVKYQYNIVTNQKNGKNASFLFKIGWSCDIKTFSRIFKHNLALLEARNVKASKKLHNHL